MRSRTLPLAAALAALAAAGCSTLPRTGALAPREEVVDEIFGVRVADPYRWMEDAGSERVARWDAARAEEFRAYTDALPQRRALYERFQELWRYDDTSAPTACLLADCLVYRTKRADQDKWVVHFREHPGAPDRVILDPNRWEPTETLSVFALSPDGRYAAYGKARAGDENPVIRVIDLRTMEELPDTLRGWRQGGVSWLHDDSGFYYSAWPKKGEVPPGEEYYWHRTWFHRLGTPPEEDRLVAADEEVKETFNSAVVSEDGRWLIVYRSRFSRDEVWLEEIGTGVRRPVATGMDAQYAVRVVGDRLLIVTDWQAPNYRVMTAPVAEPGREHWKELIPESEDRLQDLRPVDGLLYAVYQHNAATRIAVYDLDGRHLQDVPLPAIGSASVRGYWSKGPVWVGFTSFAHPPSDYTYDPERNELKLYRRSPVPIDTSGIEVEQVWYRSKDGTRVSMFLVHAKGAPRDGSVPYLLTGYGGFNVSRTPHFSTVYAVWVEKGGGVAIPNLRGGGEYGRAWHEAGMREHKQNVFDDFIAAAEWLIDRGYTSADRLAIAGGSNGGLLVAAAMVQRPDLFKAVLCQVPLTDMIRFHRFGLANIWTEEYGSPEDPEMFPHLLAYSPYHNVVPGTDYPALLVTASVNDARVDPVHARKFTAAVRWADADHGREEPILFHLQEASGHAGAVTIDQRADQAARHYGFLMAQVGLR
ncbi:MAG: S9 family peptidase [Acidobacteria bacterium]|nr:MAG: S9 family peptidase [Acidobacteriota bacterium]